MHALVYKLIFLLFIIVIFTFLFWGLASDNEDWNNRYTPGEDLTLFDCSYFVIITFSTIGYGDLSPKSSRARILTMVLTIIVVIGLMDLFAEMLILNYKKLDLSDVIPSNRPGYTNESEATKIELASSMLDSASSNRIAREYLLKNN